MKTQLQFAPLLFAAVAQLALTSAALATDYDVVIRNGRVLDGSGNPWVAADVAIAHGRFVKIGRVTGRGTREIDARDAYVSPGWIDMMDQSGAALLRDGLAESKLRQGVTTAIGGEGGTPVGSAALPGYFTTLEKQGISLNFGTYYGATQARVEVMGDVAGTPSAAQIGQMKSHVDEAMKAGAMGIATALIYPPATHLWYLPARNRSSRIDRPWSVSTAGKPIFSGWRRSVGTVSRPRRH